MSIRFIFQMALAFLFASCVKSVEDENVSFENVTHFTYGGYTYQVHHNLGLMTWQTAGSVCEKLVAFGHTDWFLPSMGEMQAARDAGLLWVIGWTSSFDEYDWRDAYYYCYDDSDGYNCFVGYATWEQAPVCPMRKEQEAYRK